MTPEEKANEFEMPVLGNDSDIIPFVPMEFLSEEQSQKNHGQTLQRLKERGGLSLTEIAAIIEKTNSLKARYTQCGAMTIIAKRAIAGRSAGLEREKELEREVERLKTQIVGLKISNEELQHYKDTTLGLWATDKPEAIEDPLGILFQLTENNL